MIRRVFFAFLVFGVTACGDDSTGPLTLAEMVAGSYTLQTINGEGLPVVVSEIADPVLVEVTGGKVILNLDLTICFLTIGKRTEENGTVTLGVDQWVECTYTFDDDTGAITLTSPSHPPASGTLNIRTHTLALTIEETLFVFERLFFDFDSGG